MNDSFDTLYGALNRLDELTDPIYLDGAEENLGACLYALDKMAESAMETNALGEAHRHRKLRTEVEAASERGEVVAIRRSDALRLSVTLHRYREKLRERGDTVGAADINRTIRVIDGQLEEMAAETPPGETNRP